MTLVVISVVNRLRSSTYHANCFIAKSCGRYATVDGKLVPDLPGCFLADTVVASEGNSNLKVL